MEKIKKFLAYINLPILLIGAYVFIDLRSIIGTLRSIPNTLFSSSSYMLSNLAALIGTLVPVALFVFLLLDKLGKLSGSRKWIAITALVKGGSVLINMIPHISYSSVDSIISSLLTCAVFVIMGVFLLIKKPMPLYFSIAIAARVFVVVLSNAISVIDYCTITKIINSGISIISVVIFFWAILRIPDLYDDTKVVRTFATWDKAKIIAALVAAVIVLNVAAVIADRFIVNESYHSSYDYDDDNDYDYSYSGNSGGSYGGSYSNKYGSSSTKCAIAGCNNNVARSGDTNCCASHSNNCLECGCYIDSDAMYCMDCLSDAYSKSSNKGSSSYSHSCYICGDTAYSKYGSYYYCSDCMALVKAFS